MAESGTEPTVVVGVADLAVAREAQGRLLTYALGSCVGVSAYDPLAKIGGLLHFMLPHPAPHADPAGLKPCTFASHGIPLLLRKLADAGASLQRLVVCAAGGAEMLEAGATVSIGKRNRAMLRHVLAQEGIALTAEDTGGAHARTMALDLARGEVWVRSRDDEGLLWTPDPRRPVAKTTP
jgi:chemotaxis protein CheD